MNEVISKSENLMNDLGNWFRSNKLTLSTNKSCFIYFKSSRSKLKEIPTLLNFGENNINRVKSVKYLGVTIEEHLNWSEHIQEVCNSLKSCFSTFYGIRDYLNTKQIRTILFPCLLEKYICIGSIWSNNRRKHTTNTNTAK